ncbi:MAG: hypothetical protein HGA16_02150 [Candidatus Moranbacteria bacterium]|nr:hypothetical protein [Candidatus Moranbacteria bacterium]
MLQYLVFVGVFVNVIGASAYIRDTLRGETQPNRVTRLLWSVSTFTAAFAALQDGVGLAALPVFASGFIPLLIFLASFVNPKAYWELHVFDYACGFFSVLALVLWYVTKEPAVAIVFAIVSDGFALIPTLVKSWKFPESESVIAYVTGLFSALTSFAAMKTWSFSELAFPTYLVISCLSLIYAIERKRVNTVERPI